VASCIGTLAADSLLGGVAGADASGVLEQVRAVESSLLETYPVDLSHVEVHLAVPITVGSSVATVLVTMNSPGAWKISVIPVGLKPTRRGRRASRGAVVDRLALAHDRLRRQERTQSPPATF